MKAPMKTNARLRLFTFLLAGAVALPALAFEYPLSSTSIREAYFISRENQQKREKFFATYTKLLPMPRAGPHIAVIQLETPFVVVVERAAQAISNYHAQDAEQEFLDKPGVFCVRVRIELTEAYGWTVPSPPGTIRLRPDDFWREFKVRLIQKDEIPSQSVHGSPIYSLADESGSSQLIGAWMVHDYNAEKVKSALATVGVIPPEGEKVEVTFDLDELR
jgi:hypothetical protein